VGVDITGWVEVRRDFDEWSPLLNLEVFLGRNYDLFGCLFGEVNHAGFHPVAASRGLPHDASAAVRAHFSELEPHIFGVTWIGWEEVRHIDWEEMAVAPDARVHRYVRQEDGTLAFAGKAAWSRDLADAGILGPPGSPTVRHEEGTEWHVGAEVYRVERLRRRAAISGDWDRLVGILDSLIPPYTADALRLIVGFDG